MQWPPKILIVGPSRSGKDEFAKMLAKAMQLRYAGSMSELIAGVFAKENGTTIEFEMAHRHEDRQKWFNKGNEMRNGDPCSLLKMGFAKGDILTGARNNEEMWRGRKIYDAIVWMHRPGVEKDSTLEFDLGGLPAQKTVVVHNAHSLECLGGELLRTAIEDIRKIIGATP